MKIRTRQVTEADVATLRMLADACPPLGIHTAFTYWVVAHFYGDYAFIALDDESRAIGYIIAEEASQ